MVGKTSERLVAGELLGMDGSVPLSACCLAFLAGAFFFSDITRPVLNELSVGVFFRNNLTRQTPERQNENKVTRQQPKLLDRY